MTPTRSTPLPIYPIHFHPELLAALAATSPAASLLYLHLLAVPAVHWARPDLLHFQDRAACLAVLHSPATLHTLAEYLLHNAALLSAWHHLFLGSSEASLLPTPCLLPSWATGSPDWPASVTSYAPSPSRLSAKAASDPVSQALRAYLQASLAWQQQVQTLITTGTAQWRTKQQLFAQLKRLQTAGFVLLHPPDEKPDLYLNICPHHTPANFQRLIQGQAL